MTNYDLFNCEELVTIVKSRDELIDELDNTIDELNETIDIMENNNSDLYKELEQLRCYKHAINALMFLYRFCKDEADKADECKNLLIDKLSNQN